MIAIADVFDALVAIDGPYKKVVNVDRALTILRGERGRLDQDFLNLFVDGRVWEQVPYLGAVQSS
jgi:HD-GYP domain-containing protein (c-di-GMP phosphodiesterase class II)